VVALKILAPLALVLGLVAAASASGATPAQVAGGDVGPVTYPSIVNIRLVRTQLALNRAIDYNDDAEPAKALAALKVARANMTGAWNGAKYVIEHAPPPAAGADDFDLVPVGGTVAAPEDTAFAVLSLQHAVAATAIGLLGTANGTLLAGLNTTLFAAMNARDAAVAYIHAIPVPPPVGDAAGAHASGAPVGSTWDTVMPGVVPLLDDELQEIDATLAGTSASVTARHLLGAAEIQAIKTERNINLWWPPVPVGD
jgi:hypothetical protein